MLLNGMAPNVDHLTFRDMTGDEVANLWVGLINEEVRFPGIIWVSIERCCVNILFGKKFLAHFSDLFPNLRELQLLSTDWAYPNEGFRDILRKKYFLPDDVFSGLVADWYCGTDGVSLPSHGRIHREMYTAGQLLMQGLHKCMRNGLKILRFDSVDFGSMYRPLGDAVLMQPLFEIIGENVELLDLEACNIVDQFFQKSKSIYEMKNMKYLLLPENHVTDIGLIGILTQQDFASSIQIPSHPRLRLIDLRLNSITLESVQVLQVLDQFLLNHPNTVIDLSQNPLKTVLHHGRILVDGQVRGEIGNSGSDEDVSDSDFVTEESEEDKSDAGTSDSSHDTSCSGSLVSEGSDLFKLLDD